MRASVCRTRHECMCECVEVVRGGYVFTCTTCAHTDIKYTCMKLYMPDEVAAVAAVAVAVAAFVDVEPALSPRPSHDYCFVVADVLTAAAAVTAELWCDAVAAAAVAATARRCCSQSDNPANYSAA